MSLRLVACLFVSALVGLGAAAATIAAGLGLLLALLAYSFTASATLLVLALATMPRKARPPRPALLPAPSHHEIA